MAKQKPSTKHLELVMQNTPYGRKAIAVKQRVQNTSVLSGGSGGRGDRAASTQVSLFDNNPITYTNYFERYRQWVALYRQSWECRKAMRIPVEDALRKAWVAEG